ncbi:MAG: hypothetical protein H6Q73_4098, partial [Firmicutes bacterium]|nr:hypothetical protein [Bacillota bacterium]
MLQKLETLRDKLSDLSKSNRSLRLLKLQDKWNFDLAALDQIQTTKHSSTQQIIKRLMSGSTPLYLISNQSEEEIGIKINQQLATLQRNLSAIEEETGLYSVYIGYPFLSGKMTDGTFVQAPIFLFPVRLEKQTEGNNPGWILTRETGEEPTINRTLLLAIQKYCQLKIDDQIYDNAKELAKENLATELCRLLTASGVTTVVDDGAMAKLPEFTQKTIPGVPEGHFTIKTHAVLGHFPQGNSTLLKDYDELIKNIKETTNLGLLEEILLENSSVTEGVSDNTLSLDIDAISHKELYNVTDLDASQEEVILGIDKTNGMVVHGPPGTGKSQVIVNLISRAIAKSQKVMVVCQKRAALDVVYQRLDSVGLADHVALVHDATTDRKQLYQKLEAVLDEKYLHQADTEANDYHKLADKIDAKTTYFNDIAAALWSRQPCELTPFQLYTRSKMLSSNEIMLNLGNLPDTISIERLEKLLTTITTLGNCYGKYGHENYSWVKRTSFATMDNSQRYELTKQLNLALSQSETIEALHKEKYTEYFTPEECWSHSIIIENGVRKVGNYNNGKFLSKLYLWFWVRFNGKPIIEKVAPDGFKDYKSDQWNQLEQRLIHLFKYTEATRTLH